jgi:hypothetical protein
MIFQISRKPERGAGETNYSVYRNYSYFSIRNTREVSQMPEASNRPDVAIDHDPEPWQGADGLPPDAPRDWRELTLARLEGWIEEEERLIDKIERRIAAAVEKLAFSPPRSSGGPREATARGTQASASPRASEARR